MTAIAGLATALAGCLGRDPAATTGSLGTGGGEARYAALSDLGKRYDRSPNDPATAITYSRALRDNNQNAQAVAVLQQAAIRNAHDLTVLGAYGKALADAGRLKEAADVLSRSHSPERPDWRILSVQGAVADQMGDFEGAQRYYEAALRLAPGEPSVLSNQGLSFALVRKLPQAEAILRQAAANPRADERVRQNLELVQNLRGKSAATEGKVKRDLPPPAAVPGPVLGRGAVKQADSWAAIRRADAADRTPVTAMHSDRAPADRGQTDLQASLRR